MLQKNKINDEENASNEDDKILIPAAVAYVTPKLPENLPDENDIADLRKNITLQIQGEAVEVGENYPVAVLMILFDIAYQLCPELVVRLNTGERILIFDHQSVPVLRDNDIITDVGAGFSIFEFNKKKYADKINIDLGKIWEEQNKSDYLSAIKAAMGVAQKQFAPCQVAVLRGVAPIFLFLLVQRDFYGKSAEIWYEHGKSTEAIKITSSL